MQINLSQPIPFKGRNGLSRSLGARFTESYFLYPFIAMALCSGLWLSLNVVPALLRGHFRYVFSFATFFEVLFFAITAYIAWVIGETSGLRLHIHGERLIFELKDKGGVGLNLSDIQSVHVGFSQAVYGLSVKMSNGISYHIPMHLERLDYILDTLHFHRPDLTASPQYTNFRNRALALDHTLSHNRHYLSRAHLKALSVYFIYPFYIRNSLERLRANPQQVGRDKDFEKKMELLCHKVNIGIGLMILGAAILFYNFG